MKTIRYLLPLIAVIPLFLLRDFTPDNELRYLSIADEALRNGDLFAFTNHGVAYADKPPLYLWIVMLGKLLFGQHCMLFLGLFSILPALGVVWIMNRWVREATSEAERTSGSLMLITSGFFLGSAVVMRMDMLMCLFIVLSLRSFYLLYAGKGSPSQRWLFPVWVFLAVFSKGPVGILVPLLSVVVFLVVKKQLRTLGRYWGWRTWLVLVLLAGAWFSGVYAEGGREYLDNLLFNQTVNRAVDSFHHKAPFWYYGVAIWYSLAPWSLLMIGVLVAGVACRKIRNGMTDLERLFLTIALTTLVMLSLISSKIQIYLLPAFPFFCYLTVLWLPKFERKTWLSLLVAIPAFILMLALPGIFIAARYNETLLASAWAPISAALLSIGSIWTLVRLLRGKLYGGINTLAITMLITIFVGSFALPAFNDQVGYGNLCRSVLETVQEKGAKEIYVYKVRRPENMDVYLGRVPVEITAEELADSAQAIMRSSVVMFRQRDLGRDSLLTRFVGEQTIHTVGGNAFIVAEQKNGPITADSLSVKP